MPRLIKTISDVQAQLFLDCVRKDALLYNRPHERIRNYTICQLMLEAGLRIGELLKLQYHDLYLMGRPVSSLRIRPKIAKGGVGREVPISPLLDEVLYDYYLECFAHRDPSPVDYVFKSPSTALPITARQVQRIIEMASMKSIGRHISPHTLRHTFATRVLRRSNLRVTQVLLGHKNLNTTQIYTHPDDGDLRCAVDGRK